MRDYKLNTHSVHIKVKNVKKCPPVNMQHQCLTPRTISISADSQSVHLSHADRIDLHGSNSFKNNLYANFEFPRNLKDTLQLPSHIAFLLYASDSCNV